MTLTDSQILQKVRTALAEDERTGEAAIEAVEENGVVTLKGKVSSREVSQAAQEIAAQQEGVLEVVNDLEVVSEKDLPAPPATAIPPVH